MSNLSFRVIGPGRAGAAIQRALTKAGWHPYEPLRRGDDLHLAASGVDVLLIATPDAAITSVATSIAPVEGCVVVHLSGSLGLDVLAPHSRRAVVHPLLALSEEDLGARRLLEGAWFALTDGGDPVGQALVEALGGRAVTLADDADVRALHHAACCVAANHLTTVLGQVEKLADAAGVPFEAYLTLARGALENVAERGAARALTGPVARGDDATVDRHRAAISARLPEELAHYDAMVVATQELAARK
ncbi:MAG: DUF2520 domain-containing protein [Actinobacteria bacterium]|nr:DUF2520 domain-containing protein [Actinomycetota bacterium]